MGTCWFTPMLSFSKGKGDILLLFWVNNHIDMLSIALLYQYALPGKNKNRFHAKL